MSQISFLKPDGENVPAHRVVIAKAGRPIAGLVPLERTQTKKVLGMLRGRLDGSDG